MVLRDMIDVHANPADVFAFFEDMDNARYLSWHPDHKVFRWTRGRGLKVGNEFYFEEVIAGKLLKKNVVFTHIDEATHIEFAPTSWLMRIFLPRLVFRLQAVAQDRYRLIAEIVLRAGPLAARLNKREFDAVREHMRIEGINLKRFAESRHQNANARLGASPRTLCAWCLDGEDRDVKVSVQREIPMAVTVKFLGIDRLDGTERLSLVEEIWASICADAERFPLSDTQRRELDRRVADDDAFPDDVLPWDEVKSLARA